MRPTERQILAVDLFCGAGGFSEGLRMAGIQPIAANDIDLWAGSSFEGNQSSAAIQRRFGAKGRGGRGGKARYARGETKLIQGDICQEEVRRQLLAAVGGQSVDLVVGGPPCQAFSQVRNHDRSSSDPRAILYKQFLRIVREIEPTVFVMENVVGMKNISGGTVVKRILKDLELGGAYSVESRILDAANYGVPQTRRRVMTVGVRNDKNGRALFPPPFPISNLRSDSVELSRSTDRKGRATYSLQPSDVFGTNAMERLLDPDALELVTVAQAIGDLIDLEPAVRLERKPSNDALPYPTGTELTAYQRLMRERSFEIVNGDVPSIRDDTVRRLRTIPQGGNYRDLPLEMQARSLDGRKWGPDLGRESLSRKHYYAYRKLHPDYFSWTLNTKTDCVYHYERERALSVREFARLHSFPDDYHFLHGDRHSRYAQIGNAVPPLLARAIALAVAAEVAPSWGRLPELQSVGT